MYPSAQIDLNSSWPKIETAYSFKNHKSDVFCSLFNGGRRNELNRSAFLIVKCHNPQNLVFQDLYLKKFTNSHNNNRLKEINGMRNGIIIDTLTTVDIVETVI